MPNSFVAVVFGIAIIMGHLPYFTKMPKWLNKLLKKITAKEINKRKLKGI